MLRCQNRVLLSAKWLFLMVVFIEFIQWHNGMESCMDRMCSLLVLVTEVSQLLRTVTADNIKSSENKCKNCIMTTEHCQLQNI
jgi:hypothetical protein